MTDFDKIINELSQIGSVKAIALAGSTMTECADELSDYDIYIYTEKEIPLPLRKSIFEKYSANMSLDNRYWELGDEMVLNDGKTALDFMYRDMCWIEGMIENVWDKHYASLGYTTCFLHNVRSSKILLDKEGRFEGLQKKISGEYPQELADKIIEKNLPLLKEKKFASYYDQIKNAVQRNDKVSINHRLTAFFASYFDIIFALNNIFHPGEKRLVSLVRKHCTIVPADFEKDVDNVLNAPPEFLLQKLNMLIMHLYEILDC